MKEFEKMKRFSRQLGIYLPILFLILTAAITLRTVACFTELNYATGYFDGKLCITVADWLTVSACIISFSYIFFGERRIPRTGFSGAATYIPSGAVCASLIMLSAQLLFKAKNSNSLMHEISKLDLFPLLETFTAILAISCTLNFFFNAFFEKKENTTRAVFGILTALFLSAYASCLYFNTALPINAPNKIVDQMAYLFSALFFIYETRISLGRGKHRPYIAFGLIAAILTAYSSLPALILYLAKGELISDSVAGAALALALFIFITSRILLSVFSGNDEPCDTVKIISAMASSRILKISEHNNTSRAHEDNEDNNVENSEEIGTNYEMQLPEITEKTSDTEENEE